MKLNLYSVYDKKSETYATPGVITSDAVAMRQIRMLLRDAQSQFAQFPDDFALVKVAEFDQISGDMKPMAVVVLQTFAGLEDSESAAPAN